MKLRPDLLDGDSPRQITTVQLTADPAVSACHVYMEAQIFTPDSKRFVLHRSATAHGGSKDDPQHQYLICDVEDGCSLHPITHELGATAPALSPDGAYLYYLVDETRVGGGRLTVKRVKLDGCERETVAVLDCALPGTRFRPSRIYPLSTISSDGQRLAAGAFLGDEQSEDAPYGLLVFDLRTAGVGLAIHGPTWCNLHPQYSRSADASHDIMIQENHDNVHDAQGRITALAGGAGGDIHLIRDDGTNLRNLPWGRDGHEFCQGHQCWQGRSHWAITSTRTGPQREGRLIAGQAAPHAGHVGKATPGGVRNELSRGFPQPDFCHFATDAGGKRFVSDAGPAQEGGRIFLASFGAEPETGALTSWTYLLNPRSSWRSPSHVHPFLSPDGTMAFFNSDESGMLQAYMITGLADL